MKLTTLCYLSNGDRLLMLHRTKKKEDPNAGKWIGIGGKLEEKESPEECIRREFLEETGYPLENPRLRGIITFLSDRWESEIMFLYTAEQDLPVLNVCLEGELAWVKKTDLLSLPLWQGDRCFLKLLLQEAPFFCMKLRYEGETLAEWTLEKGITA